ncbi:hypothetical protein L6V77_17110 [Myxococcota bacterium]|nr:hypothetical protein [Myxococcota bacterium]
MHTHRRRLPRLAFAAVALLAACSDDAASNRKLTGVDAGGFGDPIPRGRDALVGLGGADAGDGPIDRMDQGSAPTDDAGSAIERDAAGDARVPVPDPDARVPVPDPDARVPVPDPDARVPVPDPDARVPVPDPDARVAPPPDPDAGVPPPPPGITDVPCQSGPGSTLFRMHWFGGSHSADIDVWEAACDYSIAPNSACSALPICRGGIGCEVGVTDGGDALALEGGNQYLQIRFDVTGLFFERVTVYMEARGMNGPTDFEAWSPLYGPLVLGPVSSGFEYQAGAFDWTGFLLPGDDPDLTALRITPENGSLALHALELCLE